MCVYDFYDCVYVKKKVWKETGPGTNCVTTGGVKIGKEGQKGRWRHSDL
jgi:hypothetical protein